MKPTTDPTDQEFAYWGAALRAMLDEALALRPPSDAFGITFVDHGDDILEFRLAGETLLLTDRSTIRRRAAELARARN